VKAVAEAQTCLFCHAPHSASTVAPLWNRGNPGSTYTPYSSSTSVARPGQPTGASLLCLSCHDGTIALGDVLSRSARIGMAGGVTMGAPLVDRAVTDVSGRAVASAAAAGGGGGSTLNVGGLTIVQQPGQNAQQLAQTVIAEIERRSKRRL
jgi:hypothetical protein